MAKDVTTMGGGDGSFPLTRWTLLQRAGKASEEERRRALDELARAYWRPLYIYLRAAGQGNEEAKDGVQGFFAQLLERDTLASYDPLRGRFRTFLLACLKHHGANERAKAQAQKRGGDGPRFSFEEGLDEGALPARKGERTPEEAFDLAWATGKLDRAVARVRAELMVRGDAACLALLDRYLESEDFARPGYAELSAATGLSEDRVRHGLFDLRRRLREAMLEEARGETESEAAAQEEIAWILRTISGG